MGSKCMIIFLIIITTSLISSSQVKSFTDKETSRRILHQPLFLPSSPPPPPPPYQEPDPSGQFEEPFTHEIPTGPTFDQSPNAPETVPQVPSPTFEQSQQPSNVPETVPSPIAEKRSNPLKKIVVAASSVILTLGLVFGLAFCIYKQRGENHQEPHKPGSGDGPSRINEESRTVPRSSPLYVGPTEPCTATLSKDRNFSSGEERYDRQGHNVKSPPILPPPARINSPPPPMSSSEEEESRDSGIYTPHETCVVRRESPSSCINSSQVMNQVDSNHRVDRSLPHSKRTSPRSRGSTSSPDTKPVIASSVQKIMQPSPPPSPYVISSSAQFQPRNVLSYTPKRSTFTSPPPSLDVERLCSITDDDQQLMSKIPIPPPPPPPPPPLAIPRKYDFLHKHKPVQVSRQGGVRRKSKSPSPRTSPSLAKRSSVDSSCPLINVDSDKGTYGSNPKLKPLHWDKVQASSDGETVWDQLESSSFKLNEEAVDFLFGSKPASLVPNDAVKKPLIVRHQHENRVLDAKKSQNIAILLRALNVTKEEVSEALLEGSPHELGPELWETLAKMAPSKEEEIKLKNYSGEISRLGPAERFLKATLDIPFAFKRVDALLYVSNFDSEVDYLRKSFRTLEEASGELKNSRLFLKLLEAVLRTGNRMNNGTNRGDAKAFKLDTLLRLADIKGTDNKTTLLHFVVQEIIKSEATCYNPRSFRLPNEASLKYNEDDFNKQGLQVVSGLSRELSNVKKAAGMDSDVLSGYISKLETGLSKVREASQLEDRAEEDDKFSDSMGAILRECVDEISRVKAEERKALSVVREVTHYFHGGATKEEAHSFRIFKIVRDFLNVLDNVCKDVQTMQDRATMGSGRSFRMPMNASALPVVLSRCSERNDRSSDDDSM